MSGGKKKGNFEAKHNEKVARYLETEAFVIPPKKQNGYIYEPVKPRMGHSGWL